MKQSRSTRLKAAAVSLAMLASCIPFTPAAGIGTPVCAEAAEDENFARLLQHSMYFYDANMCGTGAEENSRLSWRGDCHAYDAQVPLQPMDDKSVGTNLTQAFIDANKDALDPDGDGCVDVSGGFHDAGDHVKFGMPENYTAATLGWGYYEFRDAYEKSGQDDHIETLLRYFNDYLMKCTFLDADGNVVAHCYQVGDGDIDHAYWQSPEVDSMARPAFFLTDEKPQVDYVVSAAASLTINYLNFRETDPDYAEKSLQYAKALYNFAWKHISQYPAGKQSPGSAALRSDNADGPKQYYLSNLWEDDFVWSAAWMYIATEDKTYLEQCLPYVDYYAPPGWAYCWNDMWSGANTLLGIIDMQHPELDVQNMYREAQGKNQYDDADFWVQIEKAMDTWANNYSTPQGYAFMSTWGSARYDTAMQLICLVYDKYKNNDKPSERSEWAKGQMEYLLGHNDITYLENRDDGVTHGPRCFVVGYNEYSAAYPHHRAASGVLKAEDTSKQRHVLYGALVGGPDGKDAHFDVTSDWTYNEVTIDYNAAFVGASAGLYHYYGKETDKPDENFPPEETSSGEQGSDNSYWVEAFAVDEPNNDGAGVTKISFQVRTGSSKPSDKISVRYYFDASEISNISSVECKELYDQSSAEAADEGADGITAGPFVYEGKENTYYVEVSWDGYKIANSGKKYQFSMGMYYGDKWDPSNDYSHQDLPVLTDTEMFGDNNEARTDYICVYDDGVLVGGIEPDGSVPDTQKPTDPATDPATEPSTKPSDIVYGDVNESGNVEIGDVVLLCKCTMGSAVLTETSARNADVNLDGNADSTDASYILQSIVKIIELPVQ